MNTVSLVILFPFFHKAAGLATMISTMRPDIDNIDEYVRNTTARYGHSDFEIYASLSTIWLLGMLYDGNKRTCLQKKEECLTPPAH